MHAHRLERGRLADNGVSSAERVGLDELTDAFHRAFLVSGSDDVEGLVQTVAAETLGGLDARCEEHFHVRDAEAVIPAVVLGEDIGVAAPSAVLTAHGIGMT